MIWWIVATVCAFFVKGLCGFANTLVFTTILSYGNSNVNISPVELLLGVPTNAILSWKERKHIQWKVCLPVAFLVLVGNIPGILFLKNADTSTIKHIFGFMIVIVALEMLFRERYARKTKQSKILLALIGLLSGVLCGLFGVGALLGAYISRVTTDSHEFKANICVVFLIENTFRVIMYSALGILTLDLAKQAVTLIPFVLLGLFLGIKSGNFISEKTVKKFVILMLILSGITLIF